MAFEVDEPSRLSDDQLRMCTEKGVHISACIGYQALQSEHVDTFTPTRIYHGRDIGPLGASVEFLCVEGTAVNGRVDEGAKVRLIKDGVGNFYSPGAFTPEQIETLLSLAEQQPTREQKLY